MARLQGAEEVTWMFVLGGRYEVSDEGQVRNARTQFTLRPRYDRDGYLLVTLWTPKQYDAKVRRLVLEAFVGGAPEDKPECDHINGVRDDNRLVNLRWASVSENRRNLHGPAKGASGIRGVRYREGKARPWQAYARIDGRFKSLGHFTSANSAAAARLSFDQESAQ